jgi:hypothetical protein
MLNAQFVKYDCYCPETRRNFPSIQAYQRWRWNREKKQLNNRWRREQGVKNRIAAKHAEYAHTIKELAIKQREQLAHDVAEANASHQDNKSRKNGKPMSSISGEIPHDCFVCTGAQPPTHPPTADRSRHSAITGRSQAGCGRTASKMASQWCTRKISSRQKPSTVLGRSG